MFLIYRGKMSRPTNLAPSPGCRSGAIDAVRVFGVAAVVAGHSLAFPFVRPLVYSWHVPLFFFLTGYFWSRDRDVRTELPARGRTLGLPYVSWFVVIAFAFVPLDAQLEAMTPSRLIGPSYNGESSAMPYTTFWFVSALFATALLMRFVSALPWPVLWGLGVAGSIAGYLVGGALAQTPFAIGSAVPCLIFVLLGTLARTVRPRVTRSGLLGVALLAAGAALVASGLALPLDIKQGNYGTPGLSVLIASAISFGLILVAETIFAHLSPRVHRAATKLSRAGFVVVLAHPLVLWVLLTFTPGLPTLLVFGITVTVPWLVGLVAVHSPAARWLTGGERVPDELRRVRRRSGWRWRTG
ncbi:MAG: acyltransferase [Microbacteriaceae bacterium]|nr:acyltransferase [Microbacteriaceae bacterium]